MLNKYFQLLGTLATMVLQTVIRSHDVNDMADVLSLYVKHMLEVFYRVCTNSWISWILITLELFCYWEKLEKCRL